MSEQQNEQVKETKLTQQQYLELMEVPDYVEYSYMKNLKERKIVINSAIDSSLIDRVTMPILEINEEDKHIPVEERKPIILYLYSEGGDVIAGFSIIDAIKKSKTPVYTVSLGLAASMGALILISGHKRFAIGENGTILLHDGSLQLSSTSKKAKQTMEYYDKLDDRIEKLIMSHTKISKELYDEKEDQEWYLFNDEAIEIGVIDEIL